MEMRIIHDIQDESGGIIMFMEKLNQLFDSCKFRQYNYITELYIAEALEKYYSCKCIVYGAGGNARAVVNYLVRTAGIHVEYIIDRNPQKGEIEGIPVISCELFSKINKEHNEQYYAMVSMHAYRNDDKVTADIDNYLYSEKVVKVMKADVQIEHITKIEWYDFFLRNKDIFCKNVRLFADDVSKVVYYEFLRAYLEGHSYQGITSSDKDKYFLLEDNIIEHLDDEEWINFGAFDGDTIFYYINNECKYKKIYAVEGDTEISKKLEANIALLPIELRNKIQIVNQYFGCGEEECTLDDYFVNQRITYINMDIEGAEADVLRSAQNVIQKNRPVMAICVYHKRDDLIVIPNIICSMVDQYTFFLRKYPSAVGEYFDGYFELNELVLYAVPNERVRNINK